MYHFDVSTKAVFFDLWNTLLVGTKDESIVKWYRSMTKNDSISIDRNNCMKIKEENTGKFLQSFLANVNDPYSLRFLLAIRSGSSSLRDDMEASFKAILSEDLKNTRWLPGAIDVLLALKENLITVGISNLWAYQKPYFKKNLKIGQYFHHIYLSSDYGLERNDLIKKATNDLALSPEEVLMVGDRYDNDIVPAVESGMRALKIRGNEYFAPTVCLDEIRLAINPHKKVQPTIKIKNKEIKSCLFVIPPYFKMFNSHNNRINLGITTLVKMCEKKGITAKIYHADSEDNEAYPSRIQVLFNSLNYYDNIKDHPIYDELGTYVEANKPDAVVITCGDVLNSYKDTGNWATSLRAAQAVRLAQPETYILGYGPELSEPLIDFNTVIRGELELDFIDILKNRRSGCISTNVVPEEKLGGYDLFTKESFIQDISPMGFDILSWRRGCIGHCGFCRVPVVSPGNERYRPLKECIRDLEYRQNELGLKDLYFVDPSFTSYESKVIEICRLMEEQFPGITWRAESRFDTLNKEIIPYLKRAGCNCLKLGLENALGEDHQVSGKKVNLQRAKEKIQMLHDYGIKCIVYLLLGGHWYNHSDYEQMYENVIQLNADGYTVSILTPYIGTGMGITREEWRKWEFTGSHMDIRLVDYWRIPVHIIERFYELEMEKGREDINMRKFILEGKK